MSPSQAAKAAGISRQGLMKSICEGRFIAGGIEFAATRNGRNWDVQVVKQQPTHAGQSRGVDGSTLAGLKVKQLVTKIQLDQQKLAEHDRALRRRFAECVNNAVKSAGSDFAGKARALRLPPKQAEAVGKLGQSLKEEIQIKFINELNDWEESIKK